MAPQPVAVFNKFHNKYDAFSCKLSSSSRATGATRSSLSTRELQVRRCWSASDHPNFLRDDARELPTLGALHWTGRATREGGGWQHPRFPGCLVHHQHPLDMLVGNHQDVALCGEDPFWGEHLCTHSDLFISASSGFSFRRREIWL